MKISKINFRALVTRCLYFALIILMPFANVFAFLPILSISNSSSTTDDAVLNENSQNLNVLEPANHIDPNPAKGDGDVNVVDKTFLAVEDSASGPTYDYEKNGNNGRISIYEVRPGDTLSQIAKMYNVSVNTIRWANDFSGDIKPGQSLIILPITGVRHIVKNGGSISDLAKIYDADPREIALFNGLAEDAVLKQGDEIIVPNGDMHNESKESAPTKTSKKTYTKNGVKNLASVSSGYYTNPAPGAILTQGIHGYNGVDLGAPIGTPIYAAASGSVINSKQGGWNGGYGSMIIISHENGTQTLYGHLSENIVAFGQKVKKGELIGYMGSTGKSTGSHLHFEVRGAKNPIASACSVDKVCKY